jgi:signal transduction histidine kinase
MGQTEHSAEARDLARDIVELVQKIGQSMNMAVLYGVEHKVARASLEGSYPPLQRFLERHAQAHFSVEEGGLLVNGVPAAEAPLAATIASRLTGLNLLSFVLERGFSADEYARFFTLLMTPPAKLPPGQKAADLVQSAGFNHVQAKTFSYRRVAESEEGGAGGAPSPAPAGMPPAREGAPAGPPPPDLDNVMAFLKEDATANIERGSEDIRQLASDSEKLAELILRTVEIRSRAASLADGESVADLVVGCISQVVHQVTQDPSIRTQKGRKQVKKSLMLLEKALLQRLQELADDKAAQAAAALLEEAAEDLDLETLAGTYMKSRKAAEASSEKLRRMIERVGEDGEQVEELRGRLMEQGLTPSGWQELAFRRGGGGVEAAPDGAGGGGGAEDLRMLTLLLARLDETIATTGTLSAESKKLMDEAAERMRTGSGKAEHTLEALRQVLREGESGARLSRKALIAILAELGQELSQPLTVVAASVSMLLSQRAGPLAEAQGELLHMAQDSATRMGQLVDCLIRIAGMPAEMRPDRELLDTLYQAPQGPAS